MTFYLLAFVVVLAIFGLIHSPTARERLHLRSIYTWSSEVILKQLKDYRKKLIEILGLNEENIDILEIADEFDDAPVIEEIERSDSIEEIQGIRLIRSNLSDYQIPLEAEEASFARNENQPFGRQAPEERDKVLAAITASLRRLSSAASSGKMSGTQLYDVLLQETLLHDKAMRKESLQASADVVAARAAAAAAPSAPVEETPQQLKQSPVEEASPQKARMYFGQSPLEYTPHQK